MQRPLSLFFLLVLAVSGLHAQSRIAFLDAGALLKRMPEAQDAQAQIDRLTDEWKREASLMDQELTRKRAEYEKKKLIMTDAERSSVEVDINELKKRLDTYRQDKFGASGELFSRQEKLMKPVYDKLLKAIEETAAEGKFDYVLDRGSKDHLMLYSNAKFDLTQAVAKKLGIETNDIFNIPLLDPKKDQAPPPTPERTNPPQSNPNNVIPENGRK